jgi:hypothetical protein
LIMKRMVVVMLVLLFPLGALAQAAPSGKTLASTMGVYVFPAEGQSSEQQSKDEMECYNWAVTNSGSDPFKVAEQKQSDQQKAAEEKSAASQTGKRSGVRGALRGAAAGAIIGEIADDDAGKGAAYGAAAGVIVGRRRGRAARAEAEKQAEEKAAATQAATEKELENFKKAFGVCLEAKKYMVK